MDDLPFGDAYFNIAFPLQLAQAMVNDSKNWAHPRTARNDVHTIACTVANSVMPRLADLRAWRKHVSDHLGRLCIRRRQFEDDTERIVAQLQERTNQNNDYIHKLRDKLKETNRRVKELENLRVQDQVDRELLRLPRCHRGARSSSPDPERGADPGRGSPERGRSNFDDDDEPKPRKFKDMIFEAQLAAIAVRSRSPADAVVAWREYSNSPAPQLRV